MWLRFRVHYGAGPLSRWHELIEPDRTRCGLRYLPLGRADLREEKPQGRLECESCRRFRENPAKRRRRQKAR